MEMPKKDETDEIPHLYEHNSQNQPVLGLFCIITIITNYYYFYFGEINMYDYATRFVVP